MPPVSDPENWHWTTWSLAGSMIGFAMHNSPYRITVQWRYGVYMKGPRGPFQTSITINVQNLVVTSPDETKVLKWDPVRGIAETSFSYSLECAQKKECDVCITIYSTDGMKIYEKWLEQVAPGSYDFTWDGTMNTGYYGGPPDGEEPSNIAPAGLYTFDVRVMGVAPYDVNWIRSKALEVNSVSAGFYYDESSGQEFFVIEYVLKSDRNASSGEIWLYDPDFNQVGRWDTYGLTASLTGVQHTVFIPISLSTLFEKEGTYWVVLFFKDNHADQYKNHQVKTALSGYSGVCETYYSEVGGQVIYFEYLWPEELE